MTDGGGCQAHQPPMRFARQAQNHGGHLFTSNTQSLNQLAVAAEASGTSLPSSGAQQLGNAEHQHLQLLLLEAETHVKCSSQRILLAAARVGRRSQWRKQPPCERRCTSTQSASAWPAKPHVRCWPVRPNECSKQWKACGPSGRRSAPGARGQGATRCHCARRAHVER